MFKRYKVLMEHSTTSRDEYTEKTASDAEVLLSNVTLRFQQKANADELYTRWGSLAKIVKLKPKEISAMGARLTEISSRLFESLRDIYHSTNVAYGVNTLLDKEAQKQQLKESGILNQALNAYLDFPIHTVLTDLQHRREDSQTFLDETKNKAPALPLLTKNFMLIIANLEKDIAELEKALGITSPSREIG